MKTQSTMINKKQKANIEDTGNKKNISEDMKETEQDKKPAAMKKN